MLKAPLSFVQYLKDKNIDIVVVGRKGRDFMRRRFPAAKPDSTGARGTIQIIDEYVNCSASWSSTRLRRWPKKVIKRYYARTDRRVYLLFNEFKSVISQRVIVQRILPVQEIGRREVTQVEELPRGARAHGRSRAQSPESV